MMPPLCTNVLNENARFVQYSCGFVRYAIKEINRNNIYLYFCITQ
jgi:hypothetical protein